MLFSLFKHYLDTDTAVKVSQSVYGFTTSISHFPRLWGTGISDAICIHWIASGGYYGFCFVKPPGCVERFHHYRSNKKNIIASLLKFAGYTVQPAKNNHPGEIPKVVALRRFNYDHHRYKYILVYTSWYT